MDMPKKTVIIADDHDLIRLAIRKIFETFNDFRIDHEAKNADELMSLLSLYPQDYLLLDLNMPGKSGLPLLQEIRKLYPKLKIIVLTVDDSSAQAQKAIDLGAQGYLLKENATSEIYQALLAVDLGQEYISRDMLVKMLYAKKHDSDNVLYSLSSREIEVLYYISKGKSNKEIGEVLYLSEKTVRNYSTSIFRKLDVNDRLGASILALKNGIEDIFGTIVPPK